VDDAIEVQNDVTVKVINRLKGKLATSLLNSFDVREAIPLQLSQQ
jgi:hypothetical protein